MLRVTKNADQREWNPDTEPIPDFGTDSKLTTLQDWHVGKDISEARYLGDSRSGE